MKRIPRPKIPPSVIAEQHRVACGRPPRDSMSAEVAAAAREAGVLDEVERRAESLVYTLNVTYAEACAIACDDVLERIQEEAA